MNELKADIYRLYGNYSLKHLFKALLTQRTFRVIFTLRVCQYIAKCKSGLRLFLPAFKLLHRMASHHACMDLSWQTNIRGGIALTHGWGLVINQKATIGSNVTLFHGVTLGQRDKITANNERVSEYPVIENNVWIGPNAIIVGGVTIGEGSRIAGGAFVTDNVPAHSIVVGNPSEIVKHGCLPDVVNPAPNV